MKTLALLALALFGQAEDDGVMCIGIPSTPTFTTVTATTVNGTTGNFTTLNFGFADGGSALIGGLNLTAGQNMSYAGGFRIEAATPEVLRNQAQSRYLDIGNASGIDMNVGASNRLRVIGNIQVDADIRLAGPVLTDTSTDPTVTACSGGTAATVTAANGSAAFVIDVGTACTSESTAVFTLPVAATGWVCSCGITTADRMVMQKAPSSTTQVTMTHITISTGLTTDFTDGADLFCGCRAY